MKTIITLTFVLFVLSGCEGDTRSGLPPALRAGTGQAPSGPLEHPDFAGVWVFDHATCDDTRGDVISLPEHVLIIEQFSDSNLTILSGLTGETHMTSFQGPDGFRLDAENGQCDDTTHCTAVQDVLECTHRRRCGIPTGSFACNEVVYEWQ